MPPIRHSIRKSIPWSAVAIAAVWAVLLIPTVHLRGFAEEMEQLNVATALEIKWTGHWWIPTLSGEPRFAKPPLTPWMTAAVIDSHTADQLRSADLSIHQAAIDSLARRVRSLAMVEGVGMILGTAILGQMLAGRTVGSYAAAITASSLFFERYIGWNTYDVQLSLLVIAMNIALAAALIRRQRWRGMIAFGVLAALSILCKGAVGFVFTAAPALGFAFTSRRKPRIGFAPVLIASLLMLALSLPWFISVLETFPAARQVWFHETTRVDTGTKSTGSLITYVALLARLMQPWAIWMVAGLVVLLARRWRGYRPIMLALWMVVLPLLVLTIARERKGHYLLPIVPAVAVVAGWAVRLHLRTIKTLAARYLFAAHLIVLAVFGAVLPFLNRGLPIFGSTHGDSRILPLPWAGAVAVLTLVVLAITLKFRTRRPGVLVWLPALLIIVMLPINRVFRHTAGEDRSGLEPLGASIRREQPSAAWLEPGTRLFSRQVSAELSIQIGLPVFLSTKTPPHAPPGVAIDIRDDKSAWPAQNASVIDRVQDDSMRITAYRQP